MREVFIKNKDAKHKLRIGEKDIEFINGKATVTDDEAELIKSLEDKTYKVAEPIEVKEAVKPAPKKAAPKRRKR